MHWGDYTQFRQNPRDSLSRLEYCIFVQVPQGGMQDLMDYRFQYQGWPADAMAYSDSLFGFVWGIADPIRVFIQAIGNQIVAFPADGDVHLMLPCHPLYRLGAAEHFS